jgi:hypothetical protein
MSMIKLATAVIAVALLTTILSSSSALACACGCGVFEVGTSAMFPNGSGGTASFEYDFMDQNRNWHGNSSAPSADNTDKRIRTDFYTAGAQYMFNRDWGVDVKVPYWNRGFDTDVGAPGPMDVEGFDHHALGDVRVTGLYTGFSADMSTGLEFGVKLPTGDYTYANFDRDTEIGTGSTDALLGVYHRDGFGKGNPFNWFVHGTLDLPVLSKGGYRPGDEFDAAAGVTRNPVALAGGVKVAPVLQAINSYRIHDDGVNANPDDSGYERVLVAPGLEFSLGPTKLYTDVSVPVYQHMRGEQLVAPVLYKAVVSYDF